MPPRAGRSHNLDAGRAMVGQGKLPTVHHAMSRFPQVFALALLCMTATPAAHAQDTPSDLVTRLDRLEDTVRDLTGQVQELQYRNQQLDQQLQRLQGAAPAAAAPAPPPGAPVPRSSVS